MLVIYDKKNKASTTGIPQIRNAVQCLNIKNKIVYLAENSRYYFLSLRRSSKS